MAQAFFSYKKNHLNVLHPSPFPSLIEHLFLQCNGNSDLKWREVDSGQLDRTAFTGVDAVVALSNI